MKTGFQLTLAQVLILLMRLGPFGGVAGTFVDVKGSHAFFPLHPVGPGE